MKKLAYIITSILALVIIFATIVLLPAHIQIRTVHANIPTHEEIINLKNADTNNPQVVSFVTIAEQSKGDTTIGITSVLVTWAGGKQLLIDAGMDRQAAQAFGKQLELLMNAEPISTIGPIEEQLQDNVNNIEGIVLTHLHIDHTQGLTALCNAMTKPATIFQTVHQAREHNLHTKEGQQTIDNAQCERQELEAGNIKAIEGFPGVYAIEAGGHTPGSTIYVVITAAQIWIFSGDLSNDFDSIKSNSGKGFMYSTFFIPENTALLEQWRLWLAAMDEMKGVTVLPAHDIKRMRKMISEE